MTVIADLEQTQRAAYTDLLSRVPIAPGEEVLDVAGGDAAFAGACSVGLDEAEALPFDDESFDIVLSIFGVQFAPRHHIAADEIDRVSRPGARIGLVNWTPDGLIGQLFRILGRHLPAAPGYASPPPLWGCPDHVRSLFVGSGITWRFHRGRTPWRFTSAEEWTACMEATFAPLVKARERLEDDVAWDDCRREIVALAERFDEARDGSLLVHAEYLVAIGGKRP
jgi:SAM-dependent methyltransferase